MLCDWQLQVRMLNYGKDKTKEREIVDNVMDELGQLYRPRDGAEFNYVGNGGIISNIFEAKIQTCLEDYWDDLFDSEHKWFVTAINTELQCPLTWKIENGKTEFKESFCFIDAYGNDCELDSSIIAVYGRPNKKYIYALPVKKMIESACADDYWGGRIYKIPSFFKPAYKNWWGIREAHNDFLRGDSGVYLLDKQGRKIKSVKHFDHSEPNKDGDILYPVPPSDLEGEDNYGLLTPEAVEKWKEKLGL